METLDHWGLNGSIYVGDHYTLLHTKYISSGPHDFREDFKSFSQLKYMETLDSQVRASLGPSSLLCRICVGNH